MTIYVQRQEKNRWKLVLDHSGKARKFETLEDANQCVQRIRSNNNNARVYLPRTEKEDA